MNREEIIKLAREVGMQGMLTDVVTTIDELERFAALVEERAAVKEREACAKVCGDHWKHGGNAMECADAIRARG